MNILLTGANGFLGYYLCKQLLDEGFEVVACGKGPSRLPFTSNDGLVYCEMDFTDPFAVHDVFEKYQPAVVVHAGAMSKPDECETHQWNAYVTNVEGTVTLLTNAEAARSFFVFISTDFVFDGEKGMYDEEDDEEIGPVNFYGKTKLEAEEAVREYEGDWAIVRTVLVYGKPLTGRSNLLTLTKEKLEKGEKYNVFNDQVRTPTYVEDLAAGIVSLIEKKVTGIFHLSGADVLTTYEMAYRTAEYLGLDTSLLKPVTAAEFAQPAKRPHKTGFDITKAKTVLDFQPHTFTEGLVKTFS
jgi:dTDP-4-dehydrorhamnose reductase